MLNVKKVANYIATRYRKEYGEAIDEMKLHKLLYFSQRETLIQFGEPMFSETFHGCKHGPVLKEVRQAFKTEKLNENLSDEDISKYQNIFDKVFQQYAVRDTISLSRLSHGELSWCNARIGLKPWEHGDRPMAIEDIRKDAERISLRRKTLGYM